MMRPGLLLYLYRRRLRTQGIQELLAGAGVAIAVALLLAATIAEGSIASSTDRAARVVTGPASLQLAARGPEGFDQRMLASVQRLRGVRQAAALLEARATVTAPDGRSANVTLVGADLSLAILDGLAHTVPANAFSPGAIALTKTVADQLGIDAGSRARTLTLAVGGRANTIKLAATLGPRTVGALSSAPIAVTGLAHMQKLTGFAGRITRILIQTEPGRQEQVQRELAGIAGPGLTVAPADQEVSLLRAALAPSDQASTFFAATSAAVGLLFALTAILISLPQRRRAIAELLALGARRSAIVQSVLFEALCLGLIASLLGALGGYALSLGVLHQSTGYLGGVFTIATGTVLEPAIVVVAVLLGTAATCISCAAALLDLRQGARLGGLHGGEAGPLGRRTQLALAVSAAALLALRYLLRSTHSSDAIAAASAIIGVAAVLAVPLVLGVVLHAGRLVGARAQGLTTLFVALAALRGATLRSLVLAGTGALAIFGAVALGGARADLIGGIDGFAHGYTADAQIWVTAHDDFQAASTFRGVVGSERRIVAVHGVASVKRFQGGYVDMAGQRVWLIARPPGGALSVLSSQIEQGRPGQASRRLAEGGWIVISSKLAETLHRRVGQTLTLPSPSGPAVFRIAATSTNFAWSPGTIVMSSADYSRRWQTLAPTAYGVTVAPGSNPGDVRTRIAAALGPDSGLEVSTAQTRERRIAQLTRQGLARLGEISTLLLIAAILAMASALASSIAQARTSLSQLRLSGVHRARLGRILATESALLLGAGATTGTVAGVYGQVVVDDYLAHITGFPVARLASAARPLEILALILVAALAAVAIPGWRACNVSPTLALASD